MRAEIVSNLDYKEDRFKAIAKFDYNGREISLLKPSHKVLFSGFSDIQPFQTDLLKAHFANETEKKVNSGQSPCHLLAEELLVDNWRFIYPHISNGIVNPEIKTWGLLEVAVCNAGKRKILDFLGVDGAGIAWIIEISSKHKQKQLEKQVELFSEVFSAIPVVGATAKYIKGKDLIKYIEISPVIFI